MEITDVYSFDKIIGDGHMCVVYLAHSHFDKSKKYAIKVIEKNKIKDSQWNRLDQELDILSEIDHPNLVKYFEMFQTETTIYMVQEYCEGGELFSRLSEQKKLPEINAATIL